MKGFALPAICVFLCVTTSQSLCACERWQTKVEHYTTLKRTGGSARQMNRWSALKRKYAERYRECLKSQPSIQTASGHAGKARMHYDKQSLRLNATDADDAVTKKLLQTCNYWIAINNLQPSMSNQTYRDTACRALDNQLARDDSASTPKPTDATEPAHNKKPLSECIKPGNLLDNDVRKCMTGELKPDWR